MTDTVLFVCHANVCRSRLMESDFRSAKRARGGRRLPVASAGVAAVAGQAMCDEVRSFLAAQPGPSSDEDAGAVPLDRELLQTAGLVITATRAERAEVTLLDPAMRARTFTLREAVTLARLASDLPSPDRAEEGDVLAAFAQSLDQRRGSVRAEDASGWRRWLHRRDRTGGVDIADAHHRRPREHRRALQIVHEETLALSALLHAFADRFDRHALRSQ